MRRPYVCVVRVLCACVRADRDVYFTCFLLTFRCPALEVRVTVLLLCTMIDAPCLRFGVSIPRMSRLNSPFPEFSLSLLSMTLSI